MRGVGPHRHSSHCPVEKETQGTWNDCTCNDPKVGRAAEN